MEQKVIDDFETYINADLEFFDFEGEESLSKVSPEFTAHDFSEMTGPEEFDESFDGPKIEEFDLVGARMVGPNPFMKDSIQSPIP